MSKIKTPADCGDLKVIFRYDDPKFFVGYWDCSTWNGWDCVRVDKETFEAIRDWAKEDGDADLSEYDEAEADEFGLYSLNGHCSQVCGFTHRGIFVTNPFESDCGRFAVDPLEHYGLSHDDLVGIFGENYKALKS